MKPLESVLKPLEDLVMILLKFRFPPLNFVQEAPNLLNYIYLHADSVLVFADIIHDYSTDWRFSYLEASLYRKFTREVPISINVSRVFDTPLASILLPVLNNSGNQSSRKLKVNIPVSKPLSLVIDIGGTSALLKGSTDEKIEVRQERLWLRKRDDIPELTYNLPELNVIELRSDISNKSGGYRAIDITLKIPAIFLSTEFVFFTSVKDRYVLERELDTLVRTGLGKKRDTGFGDLISWSIYDLRIESKSISILDPMVLAIKEGDYIKLVTFRNIPTLVLERLRDISILPLRLRVTSSRRKPPYWVREELCIMPFSEILVKT